MKMSGSLDASSRIAGSREPTRPKNSLEFHYGEDWCPFYSDYLCIRGLHDEVNQVVDFLSQLAGEGSALELGVGTGRIAQPLSARGVKVHGVDNSHSMLEQAKKEPSQRGLLLFDHDMSTFRSAESHALIYCVFNTFWLLSSLSKQQSCLENSRSNLAPNGHLVIELSFPYIDKFRDNQLVDLVDVDHDKVLLRCAALSPKDQVITSNYVLIDSNGIRRFPLKIRCIGPSEFDLMAENAGLELVDRWADWRGNRLSAESKRHVSVYRRKEQPTTPDLR